jgi:hypothetical protein
MATVRMPGGGSAPDDLVYILHAGLNTIAGRIHGQGPTWQILTIDTGAWSTATDPLPALLNNTVWFDRQMILRRNPNDTPGTLFWRGA